MKKIIIIGGGISGLATAFNIQEKAKEKGQDIDITTIEASERLGGKIHTYKENGYTIEAGVNGFLDNKPSTMQLVNALGIEDQLQPSSDSAKKRFIYSGGKLKKLPESPPAFFTSNLLTIKGRIRVAMEIFTKPKPEGTEETISEFAKRHMGQEGVDKIISPMVSGVFGGDAEKLSMQSCFPLLLEVEKAGNGSLVKGMIKRMKAVKKAGKKAKATAGPGGRLTSFKEGMHTLINALEEKHNGKIIKGKDVERIEKKETKEKTSYLVYLNGEKTPLEADVVITAAPAYAISKIIQDLDPKIAGELQKIPYAPISVVTTAYNQEDLTHQMDGFGFLMARNEKKRIMGSLWTSSIYPDRSPHGKFLIRTMIGGAMQPEKALLPEKKKVEIVKEDLNDILGINSEPVFVKVFQHEKAIPQYPIGHADRLELIEKRLKKHPGLFMTGNAFRGIGVNHCTEDAIHTAQKVIDYLN